MAEVYHIPALLSQTIDGLNIAADGIYIDCTFGGGGHSRAIVERLGKKGKLFGFDQDLDASANAIKDDRFEFVNSNFRYIKRFMRYYGIETVDGILADLGVSFHHFDTAERGFSFRFNSPLDMRMNKNARLTAADIINTYTEEQLADIFYLYGEVKQSRQLAAKIMRARKLKPINTTNELVSSIGGEKMKTQDLACIFQALRIEVNDELGALKEMLLSTTDLLKQGGRIAILTYHSLEDRIVKNFFKTGNLEGKEEKDFYGNRLTPFKLIGKVQTAQEDEIKNNPRSRSAKLRIAEKL